MKAGQDKNEAVVKFGDFDKDGNLDYRFKKSLPKDMLLFVVADWCPKCKTLKPMIEKLRLAGVKTAEIDVTRQTAAIKALGLKEIPATLVWRDGRVVSRHEGLEWVAHELEIASVKAVADRIAKRHEDRLRKVDAEMVILELLHRKKHLEKQLKLVQSQVRQLTEEIESIDEQQREVEAVRVKLKETERGIPSSQK